MLSSEIRAYVLNAMKLDLIGPSHNSEPKYLQEILSVHPSAYYLTGFLVPHGSRIQVDVEEDEANVSPDDTDDNAESGGDESNSLIKRFSSSIGLSFLLKKDTNEFEVVCRWGEYVPEEIEGSTHWHRRNIEHKTKVILNGKTNFTVPLTNDVEIVVNQKLLNLAGESYNLIADGTKSVSIFLVNRKHIQDSDRPDPSFMFQAEMEVISPNGFCPRPNLRALKSNDLDDRIADLQFSNIHEYATGHGVASLCETDVDGCKAIKTSWMPSYEVEGVQVPHIDNLELNMEKLADLKDFDSAKKALLPLVTEYKKWILVQKGLVPTDIKERQEIGTLLLNKYEFALKRITTGIELLNDPQIFESFKIANLVMAMAARKKRNDEPRWRTFQLAFVLMNLKGLVEPADSEREAVDLLYFPTGGGKTEAYLGVVAFTLVHRRLIDPTIHSAGVSILMRYTLRLLTLDQLERATTLICALEKVRRENKAKWNLGELPYEIGLWVGQAATPNRLGKKGQNHPTFARDMLRAYQNNNGKSPVPLEKCPWCGTALHQRNSFKLEGSDAEPTDLNVICDNRDCEFTASKYGKLPLVVVDEVIYRKLPCFIISTVDKLASMPWEEKIGKLFGRVDKFHKTLGFFSSTETQAGTERLASELKPLDLIIQDELHLISGPLGTMVGLYETAVDELSSRMIGDKKIKAKIIASTATVRHAQKQVKALYGRPNVDIFPVPGVTSKDSFFSKVIPATKEKPGRIYVGIAAQGRSTKNLLAKSYLSSMSAAQKQLELTQNKDIVDPYLTALGYFNSLRELGGARRIIEDEVNSRLRNYTSRKRVNEEASDIIANRTIKFEPIELTSRESTDRVATAKHRLAKPYGDNDFVDVAIATNMISVGLDITRLGLMLVFGQPKTTSEYIQASSRVGRGSTPGLVVTLYNIHRHRDRSLYERFVPYHQSYYRDVETTSVTPFSTKALDKGLAGTYLSIVRHLIDGMKRDADAVQIVTKKSDLNTKVTKLILDRLSASGSTSQASSASLQTRLTSLLDDWEKIKDFAASQNGSLTYTSDNLSLIHQYLDPELKNLPDYYLKFRANRSMREVEPSVNVWVRGMNDQDLED